MTRFDRSDDLRGAEFREVSLVDALFDDVSFAGATFREAYFGGARMIGVQLEDVVIDGDITGLVINSIEVEPLIEAELDRRHPGRALLRSKNPDELRAAWTWLEQQWAVTTADALLRPDAQLRLRIDDEWSFLETLRHLVFATDSWLGVGVLGRTTYHSLGLAGAWLDPTTCGLDVGADPTTAEVLDARADRQSLVRDYLATAASEALATDTTPAPGTGWPPAAPMPALARLHVILNEEWWHLQFARRDMESWTTPTSPTGR
ncbi:MAG TPA: DinB family protein [Dermatophilaceae bacterium]|nr:DinB family protein [Dermatophilaceae bacterium]